MDAVPAVSVVVPVRDGARRLTGLLDALRAQTFTEAVEVVVVDDGSTDGTAEVARRHPLGVCVRGQPPRGPYAARNLGVATTTGRVVAFTDVDCLPAPDWLTAGLERLHNGADLVGGAILPVRSSDPSVWERYDRATYLRQRAFVEEQGFAATANLFVRRHVLQAVGGFDERLRSSGDLVWSRRATGAGYRLDYAPKAVVEHHPRTTLRATWRLHRRLGAGWAMLARAGQRPVWWRDQALRPSLGQAIEAVAADGPRLRRRHLLIVHATVVTARLVGRLTARG